MSIVVANTDKALVILVIAVIPSLRIILRSRIHYRRRTLAAAGKPT
jgi:hypothetical protein